MSILSELGRSLRNLATNISERSTFVRLIAGFRIFVAIHEQASVPYEFSLNLMLVIDLISTP